MQTWLSEFAKHILQIPWCQQKQEALARETYGQFRVDVFKQLVFYQQNAHGLPFFKATSSSFSSKQEPAPISFQDGKLIFWAPSPRKQGGGDSWSQSWAFARFLGHALRRTAS